MLSISAATALPLFSNEAAGESILAHICVLQVGLLLI